MVSKLDRNSWEEWSTYVLTTLEKLDKTVTSDCTSLARFREDYVRELLEIKAELKNEVRDLNEYSIFPLKIRLAVLSLIFGGISGCAFSILTAILVHAVLGK